MFLLYFIQLKISFIKNNRFIDKNMIIYSNYDQKKQNKKSCCQKALDKIKDMLSSIKSFAKTKPIIFGLICFGIIAVIVVIIAVPVALSKNEGPCSKNAYSDECLYEKMISKQNE